MTRGLQLSYAKASFTIMTIALCATGCWSYFRQSPMLLALFILPALAILGAAVVLDRPVFPRFFYFTAGFALLIAVRGALTAADAILELAAGKVTLTARLQPIAPQLLAGAMIIIAASGLPYLYKFPKQDFEGAMAFVDASARPGEGVYTVGIGTQLPYQNYFTRSWPPVNNASELAAARARHDAIWLLFTFRGYLDAGSPELMAAIDAQCAQEKRFWGTLEGGAVIVAKCSGV